MAEPKIVVASNLLNYTGDKLELNNRYKVKNEDETTYKLELLPGRYKKSRFVDADEVNKIYRFNKDNYFGIPTNKNYIYEIDNKCYVGNAVKNGNPINSLHKDTTLSLNCYRPLFYMSFFQPALETIIIANPVEIKKRVSILIELGLLVEDDGFISISMYTIEYLYNSDKRIQNLYTHSNFTDLLLNEELHLSDLYSYANKTIHPYLERFDNFEDTIVFNSALFFSKISDIPLIVSMFFNANITKEEESMIFYTKVGKAVLNILSFKMKKENVIKLWSKVKLKKQIHNFNIEKTYEVKAIKEMKNNITIAKLFNEFNQHSYINTVYLKSVDDETINYLHKISFNFPEKYKNQLYFNILLCSTFIFVFKVFKQNSDGKYPINIKKYFEEEVINGFKVGMLEQQIKNSYINNLCHLYSFDFYQACTLSNNYKVTFTKNGKIKGNFELYKEYPGISQGFTEPF